jgi:hypothetical protein
MATGGLRAVSIQSMAWSSVEEVGVISKSGNVTLGAEKT